MVRPVDLSFTPQVVKADANPGHLQVHALEAVVWYFDIGKQAVGDFY